ncbi:MAG: class I SAM-dependent methyltransferase [Patescibacteria group bacterium]
MSIEKNNIQQVWDANAEKAESLYHMRKSKDGKQTHFGPDKTELLIHQTTLDTIIEENKKNGLPTNVITLGPTPELRDLALEKKCNVISIDLNKKVIDAAKSHLEINPRSNELVSICNWSEQPIKDGAIDFIMGSASLNNVPPDKLPEVLKEINRVLSEKGIAQFRQITFPANHNSNYDFETALNNYRTNKLSKRGFYVILRFYSFLDEAYDAKKNILYAKKVFAKFDKLHTDGKLTDEEHAYLTSFRNNVEHTVFNQEKTKELLEKYFKKITILHGEGEEYFKDLYNIFEVTK